MTDCTIGTGWRVSNGYRRVYHNKKMNYQHRVVWEEANGPIPAGMFVCHHCDNPACVNLEHLFLGTRSDNMKDASKKGRLRMPNGMKHRSRKLTIADVLQIRSLDDNSGEIAAYFGISQSQVNRIKARTNWKEVL